MGSQLAPPESLRVGLQLLGNVALAGEQHRAAVWARLFPVGFLDIAGVRESGVCDPLCMILDTFCSSEGGHRRLEELCDAGRGLPILLEIISTASTGQISKVQDIETFLDLCYSSETQKCPPLPSLSSTSCHGGLRREQQRWWQRARSRFAWFSEQDLEVQLLAAAAPAAVSSRDKWVRLGSVRVRFRSQV